MQIVILTLPDRHLFRGRIDQQGHPFQKEIPSLQTRPSGQGSISEEVRKEEGYYQRKRISSISEAGKGVS
jgi:hypothetical protein